MASVSAVDIPGVISMVFHVVINTFQRVLYSYCWSMGGMVLFRVFRWFLTWLKGVLWRIGGLSLWGSAVTGMCYLWVGTVIIARFICVVYAFHIYGLCSPGALYVPFKAYLGRFQAIYGWYGDRVRRFTARKAGEKDTADRGKGIKYGVFLQWEKCW